METVLSIGTVQFLVLNLQLNQINRLLATSVKPLNWWAYHRYRTAIVQVLQYLAEYNSLYGRVCFALLLANLPTNAFFVMGTFLAYGHASLIVKLYLISFSILQLSCIFGMHAYSVRFSRRFHGSGRYLLAMMATNEPRIGHLRTCLRVDNSIAAFHTRRVYGMSYGKYGGLITLKSWARFAVLYSKFLFITYKMITGI